MCRRLVSSFSGAGTGKLRQALLVRGAPAQFARRVEENAQVLRQLLSSGLLPRCQGIGRFLRVVAGSREMVSAMASASSNCWASSFANHGIRAQEGGRSGGCHGRGAGACRGSGGAGSAGSSARERTSPTPQQYLRQHGRDDLGGVLVMVLPDYMTHFAREYESEPRV